MPEGKTFGNIREANKFFGVGYGTRWRSITTSVEAWARASRSGTGSR